MAVKSSISLTDEQYAFARALVEAGRYASLSAVLQQGVDLLRQIMDAEELEHVALRELLSRRREGEFLSEQRMDARLSRMIAGKRRAHGRQCGSPEARRRQGQGANPRSLLPPGVPTTNGCGRRGGSVGTL